MGRFPKSESDVATLATEMVTGLTDHAVIYDAAPIPPAAPATMSEVYSQSRTTILGACCSVQ